MCVYAFKSKGSPYNLNIFQTKKLNTIHFIEKEEIDRKRKTFFFRIFPILYPFRGLIHYSVACFNAGTVVFVEAI